MANNIVYFDNTRQMLKNMSEDDAIEGCRMAVVVVVDKNDDLMSAIAYDQDEPRPFVMVGGLELVKSRVMWRFMEKVDG